VEARFAELDGNRAAAHKAAAEAMAALRLAPHPDPRFVAELLVRALHPHASDLQQRTGKARASGYKTRTYS
jgi:hypothetical protein